MRKRVRAEKIFKENDSRSKSKWEKWKISERIDGSIKYEINTVNEMNIPYNKHNSANLVTKTIIITVNISTDDNDYYYYEMYYCC